MHCPGGCLPEGVCTGGCLPGGVSACGVSTWGRGVCPGGVSAQGDVCEGEVSAHGGVSLGALCLVGVCLGGCVSHPQDQRQTTTLPPHEKNDRQVKKHYLAATSLRADIKTLVLDGKRT